MISFNRKKYIVPSYQRQINCKLIFLHYIPEESWSYLYVCMSSRFAYLIKKKTENTAPNDDFIEFNKTVCTMKALNVATVKHISTYWHYVYTNDVRIYVYQNTELTTDKQNRHLTYHLFITRLYHFINKYSTINKNE